MGLNKGHLGHSSGPSLATSGIRVAGEAAGNPAVTTLGALQTGVMVRKGRVRVSR